ncbi:MAG: hypothetical protein IKB70_09205 [Bacilli bacterium]|nr:hypothetical protein [Bacilli bacterium]
MIDSKIYNDIFKPIEEESFDPEKLEYEFYSPFDEEKFTIFNKRHLEEKTFFRLSEKELDTVFNVSKDVHFLAKHSSGIQLRFKTDSRIIKIRVYNVEDFNMKNMTFMGCSGFDTYYRENEQEQFRYHNATFPLFIDARKWIGYASYFYYKKEREIIIDFPLYNGVYSLEIGLEKGSIIIPVNRPNKKKILCYGTSILQGASSSRPGMNITNQVSRYFDQEIYNFGFSGSARLEKEVAEIIASTSDLEFVSIDAEANAGMSEILVERFETFIKTILDKQPNLPLVVFTRERCNYDEMSVRYPKMREYNRDFMKEICEKYSKLGYKICFYDKYHLFSDLEFTIEGLHPTDVGMNKIANYYIETFKEIKKKI